MIIKIDNRSFAKVEYKDYIADNLSEHGMVLFEPGMIKDLQKVEKFIKEKGEYLGEIKHLNFLIFDEEQNNIEKYDLFLNNKKNNPFAFFDFFRMLLIRFRLNYFFAFDYKEDSLFKIDVNGLNKIGKIKDFKKLFNLNKNRVIIYRILKYVVPEGKFYYDKPRVFRNKVERDFYSYKEILGENNFDVFYSLHECIDHLNFNSMVLSFDKDTILDFDIDCPDLTLKTKTLKAKRLNIKGLLAEDQDVFCDYIVCQNIIANSLLAEGVKCESIQARAVKTDYDYGLQIK